MGEISRIIYCSFCGKEQREVFLLIAGPTVLICDECVSLCSQIVVEKRIAIPQALKAPSHD